MFQYICTHIKNPNHVYLVCKINLLTKNYWWAERCVSDGRISQAIVSSNMEILQQKISMIKSWCFINKLVVVVDKY